MKSHAESNLPTLVSAYAALESSVRSLMSDLFSTACGMCTACCCRADICEEALNSAFLSQLLGRQGLGPKDIDDRYGWLDLHGCTLEYGKPPVCYAYFCDHLLARLPDEETRFVVQVLGKLMYHAGQNALEEWHLVEIRKPAELSRIDCERMLQQLTEANDAFEEIRNFFQNGSLRMEQREVLNRITNHEPA